MSGEAEEATNKIRQAYGRGHDALGTLSARHTGDTDEGLGQSEALALKTIWPTALSRCPEARFLFAFVAHAELRSAYHTVRRDSS